MKQRCVEIMLLWETGNAKGFQVKSKKIKIPSLVKSNCEIMKE